MQRAIAVSIITSVAGDVDCNGLYTNLTCGSGTVCCGEGTITPHCLEAGKNACCIDNATNIAIVCGSEASCGAGPVCVTNAEFNVNAGEGVPCNGLYTNLTCATGTVCCGADTLTPHCLEPDQNTCCSDNTTNVAIVCDINAQCGSGPSC